MANAINVKRAEVASLMDQLRQDASEPKLSEKEECTILERLKVFGRTVSGSDAIYSPEGISILSDIAFRENKPAPSREALRCLANAMFLDRKTSQYFTDGGYVERASEAYKSDSHDDEFLLGRILFFVTTYSQTDGLIRECVKEHGLAENANAAIARHTVKYTGSASNESSFVPQMQGMALQETLKLLYTLTAKLEDIKGDLFSPAVHNLLAILISIPIKSSPLQPPVHHIIDALSNIPLDTNVAKSALFPDEEPTRYISHIVKIFDKAAQISSSGSSRNSQTDEFDERGASLLKLLHDIYPIAPESVQEFLHVSLLPSDTERNLPLGSQVSTSLPARLLRLSASPTTTNTRTLLQTLLFTLSDSDASKFIKNVGYGHASGYLMMRGIAIPPEALEEAGISDKDGRRINPITGQYVDDEIRAMDASGVKGLEDMTEEEKEREAEKLFVLFERLNKTGVINVENPVRTAMQEGRFEELDSEDDEDSSTSGRKGEGKATGGAEDATSKKT
ncbi:Synembryn-A [Dactylellina cionopaga]|nr:Synembryn-A [Dactylellina cionopaga]